MHVHEGNPGREASEGPYSLGSKGGVNQYMYAIKLCGVLRR